MCLVGSFPHKNVSLCNGQWIQWPLTFQRASTDKNGKVGFFRPQWSHFSRRNDNKRHRSLPVHASFLFVHFVPSFFVIFIYLFLFMSVSMTLALFQGRSDAWKVKLKVLLIFQGRSDPSELKHFFFYGWYIHGQDRAQHVLSWLWCVLRKITDGFLRAASRNNCIKVGLFLWDSNGEIIETLRNDNLHWAIHVSTSLGDFDLLSRITLTEIGFQP